ncbi:(d)CMP kinase [Paenibacillus psychroresistens]|uniref:Cytidylate kinase n=1 Tax=Paenibacillus psychroresistens TaxID=1778678 RepID=A0A6B8RMY6_9BACL|nr:(d)CMP kinase [Paenibacillus psychroresistens]QGQ96905.1 (d)CMP kinase [Paenibacillus psychroresistens]
MGRINVALDGPAGAGKSTVARLVAEELGFVYIDTGAMYRAVTWKIIQEGLNSDQVDQVIAVAKQMQIELKPGQQGQKVFVDGIEVTDAIRSEEINQNVSWIASIPQIRELLVHLQQQMAVSKGIVMDGRDIGTHVLPDAEIKVFLTATAKERAKRRFQETKDPDITIDQLEFNINQRDRMDEQREASPLIRAEDAILLDSTEMSLSEVVTQVLDLCRTHVAGGS